MIQLLKKVKDNDLYAIVDGRTVDITEVPDPVFAEKIIGDGIAFIPEGEIVCAPASGEVIMLAKSLHAVGLKLDNGMEILIHIGIDTVELNGKGFTACVSNHQKVKKGTPLMRFDAAFMKEKGLNMIIPLIITGTDGLEYEKQEFTQVHSGQNKVLVCRKSE